MKLTTEDWTLLNKITITPRVVLQYNSDNERLGLDQLFISIYGAIPNTFRFSLDTRKVFTWVLTQHAKLIEDYSLQVECVPGRIQLCRSMTLYLKPDLILRLDGKYVLLAYKQTSTVFVLQLVDEFRQFRRRNTTKLKPALNLISHSGNFLSTITVDLKVPSLTVADSYNDDFLPVDTKIKAWVKSKNQSGLLLLHGMPGTGKTSYLKHLMSKSKTPFIYIPASMGHCLSLPSFTEFLHSNADAVFIIEDAEKLLLDREAGVSSEVSSVLNLCDGLLSDAFNIKIICTFNSATSKIDKALLRKGRLFGMYEFKPLDAEKCSRISEKLGYHTTYEKPALLTEVCNPEEVIFNASENSTLGFSLGAA